MKWKEFLEDDKRKLSITKALLFLGVISAIVYLFVNPSEISYSAFVGSVIVGLIR